MATFTVAAPENSSFTLLHLIVGGGISTGVYIFLDFHKFCLKMVVKCFGELTHD